VKLALLVFPVYAVLAQEGQAATVLDLFALARVLASASPAVMLALFIFALLKRWLLLPRELDAMEKRFAEVVSERDEYKAMLFRALNIGERAVTVAERTGPP
jgi:hypothetical protein